MEDPIKPNPLHEQILRSMREKDTEELIEIWQENDAEIWTPDALDAVEEILLERLGELPEREQPGAEGGADDKDDVTFPQDKKLIWIADLSNRLS
jgi:hypothetical protein